MAVLSVLLRFQLAIAEQVLNQRLGGAAKDAIDKFLNHLAKYALPGARRTIDIRAIGPAYLQMPLPFHDAHHRHHRGVGHLPLRAKSLVNVADGCGLAIPNHFHDFEFLIGEQGCLSRHGTNVIY
jgi:hypothetical protein